LAKTVISTAISQMKSIIGCQGLSHFVRSDSVPQLSGLEFAEFSKKYEFVNQISCPNYATDGVKIAKRLLKKAIANRKDPYLLLNYRAAPLESGKSPVEMLYGGRNVATRLHMSTQRSIPPCSR